MVELLIRCSALGNIMTDPRSKSEGILSVGAKTYIRHLAKQEIFGIDFEVSTKQMTKGIDCEQDSIDLLNRVRGLNLEKNAERRDNGFITGECDLFDPSTQKGYDLKTAWSAATFPAWAEDCGEKGYEWQARGYMWLWGADEWEIVHSLVDTPDYLIGYEPIQMHTVSHIPDHMRLTGWVVTRDKALEEKMIERVKAAREYMREVIFSFNDQHKV